MDVRDHLAQLIGELVIRIAELSAERDSLAANQRPPKKAKEPKPDGE